MQRPNVPRVETSNPVVRARLCVVVLLLMNVVIWARPVRVGVCCGASINAQIKPFSSNAPLLPSDRADLVSVRAPNRKMHEKMV